MTVKKPSLIKGTSFIKGTVCLKIFHLSSEIRHTAGGLVLRVGGDVASLDVLDGDVLDVETNVVTGHGLRK